MADGLQEQALEGHRGARVLRLKTKIRFGERNCQWCGVLQLCVGVRCSRYREAPGANTHAAPGSGRGSQELLWSFVICHTEGCRDRKWGRVSVQRRPRPPSWFTKAPAGLKGTEVTAGEAERSGPGQLQPAGISTAAIGNPAATAGVCAARKLTAKPWRPGPSDGKGMLLMPAGSRTQTHVFTLLSPSLPLCRPFEVLGGEHA